MTTQSEKRSSSIKNSAALVVAILITAVLGLAAAGKLLGARENEFFFGTDFKFDHVIAVGEIVMILLVLALHRWKYIWPAVAVMFSGFFGYAMYWTLTEGKPCGCFGELWEPPLGVSMGIDIAAAISAVGLMIAYGGRKVLIPLTLVVSGGVGWFGYDYAYDHSPEKALVVNEGVETPDRFMLADMASFATSDPDDPIAHLVFIHEIGCHVCESYLGDMKLFGELLESRDDELLRIHEFSVDEVETQTGIEGWEWPEGSPPVLFFVQYGEIQPVPGSDDLDRRWWTGEDTPFDIIRLTYEDTLGGDYVFLEDELYAE